MKKQIYYLVSVGRVRLNKLTPTNKLRTKLTIRYERKIITSPTIAATIVSRAFPTPSFSPWEVSHLTPPMIRKTSARSAATTKRKLIAFTMTFPKSDAPRQSGEKFPPGHVLILIPSASAKGASVAKPPAAVRAESSFLMDISILGRF